MKLIRSFFILSLAFAFLVTTNAATAAVSRWSFIQIGTGIYYPVEVDHQLHVAFSTDPNHFFYHPLTIYESKIVEQAYRELGGDGTNVIEFELSLLKGAGIYIGLIGIGLGIIALYAQYQASQAAGIQYGDMCGALIESGHAHAAQQAAGCNPFLQTRPLPGGRTEVCIHGQAEFSPSHSPCGGVQFAGCTRSSCSAVSSLP